MSEKKAISVSSLCKNYRIGDFEVEALKKLNLEVLEREFILIHGPSGAGKTTLLNLIGGLDKPTDGKIIVFGHNLADFDEDFLATFRSANIGFVFQSYNLISTLTALENVAFPIELAGWPQKRVKNRSEKLLKQVDLQHRAEHFPSQLSGGEQQRIAFARALANDPPLILVDEPTGNLDLETGFEIVRMLDELKAKGKTIVVVTHDERIMQLADRVLYLREGGLVATHE